MKFPYIKNMINNISKKEHISNENINKSKDDNIIKCKNDSIVESIDDNIAKIKDDFGNASDLFINYSNYEDQCDFKYVIVYINTLIDSNSMNDLSMELKNFFKLKHSINKQKDYADILFNYFSGFRKCAKGYDYNTVCEELVAGSVVILVEESSKFLSIKVKPSEARAITEPTSQTIIRGPKEAFTERVSVNIGLIRNIISNKNLRVENLTLGSVTNTTVNLVYINGIAKNEIVNEIKKRISGIKIDGIFEGGYIEECIKDHRYSIFPTFMNSEKPDSVAAALLEGRVAILVDGSPYCLTAPALFIEFFQVSEDYYHNYIITSFIRFIRLAGLILALIVPATYVALITFQQEMLPTTLLVSIVAQREAVPFPALIEVLLMEITFEILREAGIRMPKAIGPAISIVGALVLGQAAVEAGIISAFMVIIVSITAISSFCIPNYEMSNAIRVSRFIFIFAAGIMGLYGVFMALIVLVFHLCHLKSIGVPYLTPIAPKTKCWNQDTIFRSPFWSMKYRTVGISATDTKRVDIDEIVTTNSKEELR